MSNQRHIVAGAKATQLASWVAVVTTVLTTVLTLLLTTSSTLLAQAPDNGTPAFLFDSPLATLIVTPTPTETVTATPTAAPTLTPTATATLLPTPTQDLSSAVLQISPLRVAPNDLPISNTGALLWLAAALTLVLAGAVIMAVRK